jgi:phenylacetate-coenzyme A ligase PaaK-like adenylate-forming protein
MNRWLAQKTYFTLQRLRGEPVRGALEDLRRTEFISREELLSLQAERQLAQLRFVIDHVPWYQGAYAPFKEKIRKAQGHAEVAELMAELPALEKDIVTSCFEKLKASGIPPSQTYPDKTSGSSGTPLMFPCDKKSWAYRHALHFRQTGAFGVKVGDPYALFFGLHWNRRRRFETRLRDITFNRVRVSAFEISPENVVRHLESVRKHRPVYFLGYPSAIYDFCFMLKDRNLDLRDLGMKAVCLTAEPLHAYQRELIMQVTGSPCINEYGSAEGGLSAFECPEGSLHLSSEVTSLQVREPGATEGDALVTDMMLRAFPLIRYAIGDRVALKDGLCKCGRPHPMLQSVEGRSGITIHLPNGRRVNANLPSYIFKPLASLNVIQRYRFVQSSEKSLELYLVVGNSFREEHRKIVEREMRTALGEDLSIPIQIVDQLPHLPNAKHRDYVRAY